MKSSVYATSSATRVNRTPAPIRWNDGTRAVECGLALAVLAAMTALPLVEIAGRAVTGRGVSGTIVLVQHLTLWITLVGAVLAARGNRMLALSVPLFLPKGLRAPVRIATSGAAAAVTATLAAASFAMTRTERVTGETVGWGIPTWWMLTILPAGFAAISWHLVASAAQGRAGRALAAIGLAVPVLLATLTGVRESVVTPALVAVAAAAMLGMPVFAAIGGAALLLFWGDGTPLTAVPGDTYRLTVSPLLPAIPLFALCGYVLAEGGASARLARLFMALVGWLPGGLAFATTGVLAFFTPLTGASGVTILSMGGLFHPVLRASRYGDRTALGLVTVSGSIGLLFFPSLPVFLYGYYANQPFDRLFVGALLPGSLLVLAVAGYGAIRGWSSGAARSRFSAMEMTRALGRAKWELGLPVVVLGSLMTGLATPVESAALSVLYVVLVECVILREISVLQGLPQAAIKCATLIGGFLIILSVALGFTKFLIIAEVPDLAVGWVQSHVTSPVMFLLALNVFLIAVGALMDIYSATVVVVPIVAPVAAAYGIDPIHLGIVFLANMELGYLMPPMGENLFLASYRFDRPLTEIYRATLPYVVILLLVVLLITYLPWLTLWPLAMYDGR